jgi:uncharacterized protein (DUF1684 family)
MKTKSGFTFCSLALVILGGISGCAHVTSPPTHGATGPTGTVSAFLTDAPADGVVAFSIQVTGVSLVGSNGISTSISRGIQEIEMRHLQLAPTLAFQGNVPPGTFTALNMAFANPQITLADAQGNVTILNGTTTPSVHLSNFVINDPINVVLQAAASASLAIDFNLRQSLQQDSRGNYTVTPTVSVNVITDSASNQDIENAEGIVVSAPSPNSVNLQLRDTGQVVSIVTSTGTLFADDTGQMGSVETGQFVEVDAQMQSDGSFLATRVDSVSSDPPLCFSGIVAGVIPNPSGNPSIEVVVQE